MSIFDANRLRKGDFVEVYDIGSQQFLCYAKVVKVYHNAVMVCANPDPTLGVHILVRMSDGRSYPQLTHNIYVKPVK